MRKLVALFVIAGMVAFVACGPKGKSDAEKKTADSLKEADSIAKVKAKDSIAAADQLKVADSTRKADSIADAKKKDKKDEKKTK